MTIDRLSVINLDRCPERYAELLRLHPDMPFERVSAVEGRSLDRAACVAGGLITAANAYALPALGSLASHTALWRRAVAQACPVHVAEDDILIRRDFTAAAAGLLRSLGDDWDIVLWGWNFDWPMKVRLSPGLGSTVLHGNPDEHRAEWPAFSAVAAPPVLARLVSATGIFCYSISPRGAARLLTVALPVGATPAPHAARPNTRVANRTLDVEMTRHYGRLSAFVALPPLAAALNDYARSTLHGGA